VHVVKNENPQWNHYQVVDGLGNAGGYAPVLQFGIVHRVQHDDGDIHNEYKHDGPEKPHEVIGYHHDALVYLAANDRNHRC
jgi:hypothetical protein